MQPVIFYFAAAALVGLSTFVLKRTSPYSRCGGVAYEKRRMRRLAGEILLFVAALALGVGLLAQLHSQ
jgi:hypothetical protein